MTGSSGSLAARVLFGVVAGLLPGCSDGDKQNKIHIPPMPATSIVASEPLEVKARSPPPAAGSGEPEKPAYPATQSSLENETNRTAEGYVIPTKDEILADKQKLFGFYRSVKTDYHNYKNPDHILTHYTEPYFEKQGDKIRRRQKGHMRRAKSRDEKGKPSRVPILVNMKIKEAHWQEDGLYISLSYVKERTLPNGKKARTWESTANIVLVKVDGEYRINGHTRRQLRQTK